MTGDYPEFESVPNVFEVDTTFYFGVEDAQNTLTAEEVFGMGTEDVIVSIKDENGATIAYNNGVITLPEGLTAGTEYTWTVSNGTDKYIINVFIATNVIRTTEDLNKFFNYSEATDYYTTGASGYYVLANNLDASGYTHTHGMKNSSGQGLTGTFDGRGYTIDGITLTNAGLFGYVKGGTIKNVALTNVNVSSTDEAYVITQQSAGMTIDNVYVGVTYAPQVWNQGMFEKPWGQVAVSNVMVVATGGNENTFALGAMWDREANYTYKNVYVISELSAVRKGETTGITLYTDTLTFATNVDVSALTNFNKYWDLTGAYPVFTSGLEYESGELYEGVHLYNVRASEEKIVENGETKYKIIRPDNATTNEINAIYELQYFFAEATGITLEIVYDCNVAYSLNAKYISIGETNYASDAGVIAEYSLLKSGGFRIVTVDNSIIIKGASDRGTLYGVYEFLAQCFNYEYFSDTAIRIDTNVTELALIEFDITDVPDFEYNLATYGYVHNAANETVRRYRMVKDKWLIIPVGRNMYHNSFDWFPKETYYANHNQWYSTDGQQLCYTAHGDPVEYAAMIETATQTAKALLSNPAYLGYNVLTLTQQDGRSWCKCTTCTATAEQYNGSNAAVVIHFLNALKTNIDAWFLTDGAEYSRDLKLLFFGYHQTNKPPTIYNEVTGKHELVDSTVKCVSGVGVFFAETDGDYTQDFFADSNAEIANNMVGYGCVTEDIFFWSYQTNFSYYLTPYNSFDSMQSIYQYAKYNNAFVLFDQGQYNELGKATAWAALKVYLNSKLAWNVNADMNTLIDDFFINYFGPAGAYMREMFDSYIAQARLNSDNGYDTIWVNALQESFWSEELLNSWISCIDEALDSIDYLKTIDIDSYNAYSENIRRERLSVLYLLIELYGTNLDSTTLQSYKTTFYNDAQEFGLTLVSEKGTLETLYSEWGLS